jgi:hypothetical protein
MFTVNYNFCVKFISLTLGRTKMTALISFDECFEEAFSEGLSDIKFFVRRTESVSAEVLMSEALAFQNVIKTERVTTISAVD